MTMQTFRRRTPVLMLATALMLLMAACGGRGEDAAGGAPQGPTPVVTVVLTPVPADQPVSPLENVSMLPTPTPQQRIAMESVELEAGKAAITGRVVSAITGEPLANIQLRLGEVFCPEGVTGLTEEEKRVQCAVVLDDAWNPFAESDDEGRFLFQNIEARDYTFMAGYDSGGAAAQSATALNEAGLPRIYTAIADETVDLGDVAVDYQP